MSTDSIQPLNLATTTATEAPLGHRDGHRDAHQSGHQSGHRGAADARLIHRRFTRPGKDPFADIPLEVRDARIQNPDRTVVFEMHGVEVPSDWSQLASDILASKYFRKTGVPGTGSERSVLQVVTRIARTLRQAGEALGGYFTDDVEADAFEAELSYLLIHQIGAFNSPVWFNCGLAQAYGITGRPVGSWIWDPATDSTVRAADAYSRPQLSACFIQSIKDDLMDIAAAVQREMLLFKFGSGTGTNFSSIRGEGERLSGGGTSSGLMSFLEILDRAAGATKSGGTTRRAAKMVILDMDHPDIEKFVNWKAHEEEKAAILIASGLDADFNGEAYRTVSGQNSNNSVRISDAFMQAVIEDREWKTTWRTTGEVARVYRARDLMRQLARAAWRCADPGVQFDTNINRWHTSKASGRINGSNPCVTGDTLVATAEGWQRIDSLTGKTARIIGADGQPHWVTQVFPTGRKPVFRLRTRAGYEVRITADHKVWTVERGDVPASELVPGERVQLQGPGFGRRSLGRRLAAAIGVAVGDGCLVRAHHATGRTQETVILTMAADEAGVLDEISGAVNEEKRARRAVGAIGRADDVHVTASGGGSVSRLAFSSQPVVDLFKEFAVLDQGSDGKRFMPSVFELDRMALAGVLRGLFTADGTVANYGKKSHYVSLDSTSIDLLKQVQLLLLGFGIKSKLYRNRRAGNLQAVLPDGRGGMRAYPAKEIHSLRISRSSRFLFEQEIGFHSASPKAAALQALNDEIGAYRDELTDAVASIEPLGEAEVYDLTEETTHHFVANGLLVHNCSEYLFLDDSACNLSSINLMKFVTEKDGFDVEGYRHAITVFTTAMEIIVDFASYPTETIARNSHDFRPLGLGYANLGTLLMVSGIPYDSPAGREVAASLSAVLCGRAYATSAEIAARKGPFTGYSKNRESMLEVMNMHRDAAQAIPTTADGPAYLVEAAREDWDRAVALGERFGYRNAQATVIAPTGTIGLLMDCDTTGIEPDFALVKFKKLAGGGYFKIVNRSVNRALRTLGYTPEEVEDILRYVTGTLTLTGAPHLNRGVLLARGFAEEDLDRIERALPGVFEFRHAFVPAMLGPATLARLNLDQAELARPGFDLLTRLGFTPAEIAEAEQVICGRLTIEGAPHLKAEHLPVFDCANRCGRDGRRFIDPMGHIRMMAAVQPFISGAISKTINMPEDTTVEDIDHAHLESWRLGLKAVAIYRDGCKRSQPLSASGETPRAEAAAKAQTAKAPMAPDAARASGPAASHADNAGGNGNRSERGNGHPPVARPSKVEAGGAAGSVVASAGGRQLKRQRLSKKRRGFTQEARVGNNKVYLRTGEYPDGRLGEIFIDMHKEGAAFRSIMNCFAISVSLGLQHGVPLEEYVDAFIFTRFDPQGPVDHPNIKFATSVVDYIFRVLGMEYLGRTDFVQVKPADADAAEEKAVEALAGTSAGGSLVAPASGPAPRAASEPAPGTPLEQQMRTLMGDAPFCDVCGNITVRNGTCYRCLNCGNSMGCS